MGVGPRVALALEPASEAPPASGVAEKAAQAAKDAEQLAQGVQHAASSSASDPWVWVILVLAAAVLIGAVVSRLIRPAVSPQQTRDVSPHPFWIWAAAAFLVWVTFQITVRFVFLTMGDPESARTRAVAGLVAGLMGVACGGVLARVMGSVAPNSGLTFRVGDLARGFGCFLLALPVVLASGILSRWIYVAIYHTEPSRVTHSTLKLLQEAPNQPATWLMVGSAVALAPIYEELCFRGFLQSSIARVVGARWFAVLAATLVFTVAHVDFSGKQGVDYHALPMLFTLSLTMGHAFERTRRIGTAIVMHFLFNLTNVIWLLATMPDKS